MTLIEKIQRIEEMLQIPQSYYNKHRILREIRDSFNEVGTLTDKQIKRFNVLVAEETLKKSIGGLCIAAATTDKTVKDCTIPIDVSVKELHKLMTKVNTVQKTVNGSTKRERYLPLNLVFKGGKVFVYYAMNRKLRNKDRNEANNNLTDKDRKTIRKSKAKLKKRFDTKAKEKTNKLII